MVISRVTSMTNMCFGVCARTHTNTKMAQCHLVEASSIRQGWEINHVAISEGWLYRLRSSKTLSLHVASPKWGAELQVSGVVV